MDKDLKFKVILLSLGLLTLFLYSSYAFGGDIITETKYHKRTITPNGGQITVSYRQDTKKCIVLYLTTRYSFVDNFSMSRNTASYEGCLNFEKDFRKLSEDLLSKIENKSQGGYYVYKNID